MTIERIVIETIIKYKKWLLAIIILVMLFGCMATNTKQAFFNIVLCPPKVKLRPDYEQIRHTYPPGTVVTVWTAPTPKSASYQCAYNVPYMEATN